MRLRVEADQASISKTGAGRGKRGNMRLRVEADQASVSKTQAGRGKWGKYEAQGVRRPG